MRKCNKLTGGIRSLLLLSILGLAACGAQPKGEDVTRLERSDMVPSTAEILRPQPRKAAAEVAKVANFETMLNEDVSKMLRPAGYDVELDVLSFMVPDKMQANITGARAFVAANVTLRTDDGEVLVRDAKVTFVTPTDGPLVTDAKALTVAFCEHLEKSMQLR